MEYAASEFVNPDVEAGLWALDPDSPKHVCHTVEPKTGAALVSAGRVVAYDGVTLL